MVDGGTPWGLPRLQPERQDRTVASTWSVRPTPDARVSMPLEWDEVADCDPATFTLATAPARFAERGDASAGIDSAVGSLDALLQLIARGCRPRRLNRL